MANIAGKSSSTKKFDFSHYFRSTLWNALRVVVGIFIVLMILVLWTDDLYDYSNWDVALGLQIFGFLGLMLGFALFYFKPTVSGWIILGFSLFFWIVTSVFRGMLWLGWLYLVFPLLGILIIVLIKIQSFIPSSNRKRR